MTESEEKPHWLGWVAERIPNWDTLISMSRNKIVNSSYVFLFVTPIAAKVTQRLPELVEIPVGSGYQFSIALPFSWLWLFWCAVAASLANLIVLVRCPSIVGDFREWDSFERTGKEATYIARTAKNIGCTGYPFTTHQRRFGPASQMTRLRRKATKATPDPVSMDREVMAANFNGVRDYASLCFPWSRAVATALYLVALSCFGWIIFRNLCFVVSFMYS